ncbi:hypothetical protein [Mycolicibacterium boenickei]|uniref:hypothetical protein n=1 Tax=Mycolicibacterium boenickei TaxID=146017 RepID=UPI00098BA584|nr:hypothetical protein [Mycolicibacterium boenickei]
MNGSTPRVPSDGPIPAELLADLQAGLLDDTTAADVRRRVRTDPLAGPDARNTLAALDRVRRDLRELGADSQSAPRAAVGLSEAQILGLLSKPPDLGPLADAKRRTACLTALGYSPGVRILGAQPVEVAGQRGVLVLMPPNPPDTPESVVAVALAADCDAGHAGSLAQTVVKRPARHP